MMNKSDSHQERRIRILYVQPTSEVGGSDICLLRMLRFLDQVRYEPFVLLPSDGPLVSLFREAGAKVFFLALRKLTSRRNTLYLLEYIFFFIPAVIGISRIIRKLGIDLVHTNSLHCWYGAVASWIMRRPHVWHVREIVTGPAIIRKFEVSLARNFSSRIITMSDAIAEMFRSKGVYPKNLVRVYEGTDLAAFRPGVDQNGVKGELGIASDRPLLGMISRLDPWKGIEVFIRACGVVSHEFPQVKFLICGGEIEGHEGYEARLRKIASEIGLSDAIWFAGWRYTVDEVPRVLSSLTALVSSSVNPEPFGLTLIEAMACGKSVIATAAGGPKEIVVDGVTGYLVKAGDVEGMARAMVKMLRDKGAVHRMGLEGRMRAEKLFDWKRNIHLIEHIYEGLVRG